MRTNRSSPPLKVISLDSPAPSWAGGPGYLDTANYGLAPRAVAEAVAEAVDRWQSGRSRIDDWIDDVEHAREGFARLIGVPARTVACSSTTSQLVGVVASSLPDGARVVLPREEFTSNVFPWLAHEDRGVEVMTVPMRDMASAIDERTNIAAFSLAQSATGEVADVDAITRAARAYGARVLIDATQACGWLPFDAGDVDYVVCSAYKWLMGARGTAFLAVRDDRIDDLRPTAAGWFAGREIYSALYGPPLRIAEDARRLDTSPSWICWAGTARALDIVHELDVEAAGRHDLALASAFCAGIGEGPPSSPIVSVPVEIPVRVLNAMDLVAGHRAGKTRFSFHVYNTADDVALAVAAVAAATHRA